MINWVEVLGYFSGFCTTLAFVPQVYKIWKFKSVKDISLITFAIFNLGVFGWLFYAFLISDFPLILANFITLFLAFSILIGIIKFK